MKIRASQKQDTEALTRLIDQFRMALAAMRSRPVVSDMSAAMVELDEYILRKFPIYVAEEELAGIIGYMVLRVDGNVVWVESIFVCEDFRRKGVASRLYEEAEYFAQELGGQAPYNWVDPHNERMIDFLHQRGYDVLNLIELRRRQPDEELAHKVRVGEREFYRR